MTARILILSLLLVCLHARMNAQCSDAGVCSIGGGHKPSGGISLSADYSFGTSGKPDDLKFHSFQFTAGLSLPSFGHLSAAIPFNSQSGPLGSTSGIGDLTVILTRTLAAFSDAEIALQVGGKVSLADVNQGSLPQAYQSGLGTNDLLAGVLVRFFGWHAAAAYQHPFGTSGNTLTRLDRGADLLIRLGHTAEAGPWNLGAEALLIRRLAQSTVVDPLNAQNRISLPGSDQTQINLVARADYPLAVGFRLQGMLAVPLLKRDVNVDGLTRALSVSAGLSFSL